MMLAGSIPDCRAGSAQEIGGRQGLVGAPLKEAERDEVPRGRRLVRAEGEAQVGIVVEVPRRVERVAGATFGVAVRDEVLCSPRFRGAERQDQVIVGGDILQPVEAGGPVFAIAVSNE